MDLELVKEQARDLAEEVNPESELTPLLVARGISCERGDNLLFDGLDLSIDQGSVMQIAGPNGSGKTTLLRAICGLFDSPIDTLTWRGIEVTNPLQYADELLYLGHRAAIRPHLTLMENLSWYSCLSRCTDKQQISSVIDEVGLGGYEAELTGSFSAGQKRRVALARLRLVNCRLWVLDEPFASLDVAGVDMLRGWIEQFVISGGSVIYSTHQVVEFDRCQSEVLDIAAFQRGAVQ